MNCAFFQSDMSEEELQEQIEYWSAKYGGDNACEDGLRERPTQLEWDARSRAALGLMPDKVLCFCVERVYSDLTLN